MCFHKLETNCSCSQVPGLRPTGSRRKKRPASNIQERTRENPVDRVLAQRARRAEANGRNEQQRHAEANGNEQPHRGEANGGNEQPRRAEANGNEQPRRAEANGKEQPHRAEANGGIEQPRRAEANSGNEPARHSGANGWNAQPRHAEANEQPRQAEVNDNHRGQQPRVSAQPTQQSPANSDGDHNRRQPPRPRPILPGSKNPQVDGYQVHQMPRPNSFGHDDQRIEEEVESEEEDEREAREEEEERARRYRASQHELARHQGLEKVALPRSLPPRRPSLTLKTNIPLQDSGEPSSGKKRVSLSLYCITKMDRLMPGHVFLDMEVEELYKKKGCYWSALA